MGILERTRHVVRADLNDLLRKAKNPETVLDVYIDELRSVMDEAESLRAVEAAQVQAFDARLRDVVSSQQTWENKAKACLRMGDEALARSALEKKFDLDVDLEELSRELEHRNKSLEVLDSSLDALKLRISEVVRKKREIQYRRQVLEARGELQRTLGRLEQHGDEAVLSVAEDGLAQAESTIEAYEVFEDELTERKVLSLEAQERKADREKKIAQALDSLKNEVKK